MSSFTACVSSPILRPHRLRSWLAACASALLLAACGGGGGGGNDVIDDVIGAALNFEGQFEAADGLVIELDGEAAGTATIVGFGTSPLGTNTSLLSAGQPFARNVVRTGDTTFSADVIVPSYDDEKGKLNGTSYAPVTISLESDTPVITGLPAGYPYATGWTAYQPTAATPPDPFGVNCQEVWEPILAQGSGRWLVSKSVWGSIYGGVHPDYVDWTWTFSNFRSGRVHVVQSYYSLSLGRTVTPDPSPDAEFGQFPLESEPHCRINADAAGVLFFKSYNPVNGELVAYENNNGVLVTLIRD